jgi:hypothetical protein
MGDVVMKHTAECQMFRTVFQFFESDEEVAYAMCDRLQALLSETAVHAYSIQVGPNQPWVTNVKDKRWFAQIEYCRTDRDTVNKAWEIANTVRTVIDMPDELRS